MNSDNVFGDGWDAERFSPQARWTAYGGQPPNGGPPGGRAPGGPAPGGRDFNARITEEFCNNGGKVGGQLAPTA